MTGFKRVLFVALSALTLYLAILNAAPATLTLWPFMEPVTAPVFVIFLIGLLLGLTLAWIIQGFRAWSDRRTIAKLQAELDHVKVELALRSQREAPKQGADS